jgi:hypothetical protein
MIGQCDLCENVTEIQSTRYLYGTDKFRAVRQYGIQTDYQHEWRKLGETEVKICRGCVQATRKKARLPSWTTFALVAAMFPVLAVRLLGQASDAIWFVAITAGVALGFTAAMLIVAIRSPSPDVLTRRLAKRKIRMNAGKIPKLALWTVDQARAIFDSKD